MALEDARGRCEAIAEALAAYGVEPKVGAEIGVYEADLSAALLTRYPDLVLYMVDWWREAPPDSDYRMSGDKLALLRQDTMDRAQRTARKAVAFTGGRAVVLEAESGEAAEAVPDESLNFVFVDGDHTFDAVYRDLELWVPKVRSGGVVGGHDWYETRKRFEWFEVPQAVRAFRAEQGITGEVRRGAETTWFFRKP